MKHLLLILPLTLLLLACGQNKTETHTKYPDKLIGMELNYSYSGGNEYVNRFSEEGLTYQFRSGSKPDKWWGPNPYNYMLSDGNEHIISWHEKGNGDFVTLIINLEKKTVIGSALVHGKKVHFQKAKLHYFKKF
ncbi:hypothetical protein DNU06_11750 [Putridiphycobacter roseus]|uniref:Molybdenum cofactor biosynthesis protein F N-terminal domain-containing protein n=1 Tax=Putridiphycobacter roseus TaxID=2219161 RepID=A0A2W1NB56_9FLAO|nr:hypothetical protein [Putridiphycobacter roseus]PZE16525.1 hypothetical protein DNU06_11750 [Putridiphycobacter roseus]